MLFDPLSPADYPPVRGRPAYAALAACLERLASSSSSSSSSSSVIRYLSSIVASDLAWLPDDDHREAVWAAASRCLADRCGRTAAGEITRDWVLPGETTTTTLTLAEPPLVGDSLGLKTWGTSYALACALGELVTRPSLRHLDLSSSSLSILELGAGTGLLGLAAAATWPQTSVRLTDLPDIVPNLAANVARNAHVVAAAGSRAHADVLVWGKEDSSSPSPQTSDYPLLLAADPLYDDHHPALLAHTMATHLAPGPDSRALVAVPLRDRHSPVLADAFVAAMGSRGLAVLDTGRLAGRDADWGGDDGGEDDEEDDDNDDNNDTPSRFTCVWWVFGRQDSSRATD